MTSELNRSNEQIEFLENRVKSLREDLGLELAQAPDNTVEGGVDDDPDKVSQCQPVNTQC